MGKWIWRFGKKNQALLKIVVARMYRGMENGEHLDRWGGLWRSIIETRMLMGKIHFKASRGQSLL